MDPIIVVCRFCVTDEGTEARSGEKKAADGKWLDFRTAEATQVSTDERVDKRDVVYTFNGILFGFCKRKDLLTRATTWMVPGDIILSAISQSQKNTKTV